MNQTDRIVQLEEEVRALKAQLETEREKQKSETLTEDLEKLNRRQAILIKVLQIMQSAKNLPQAMNEMLTEIGKFTGVSRVYVFEKSDDETAISCTFDWSNTGITSIIDDFQNLPIEFAQPMLELLHSTGIVNTSCMDTLDPKIVEIFNRHGEKSVLILPLIFNDIYCGFVGFDDCVVNREWDKNEVELLRSLSQILSATSSHFHAEHELVVERDRLQAIGDNFPGGSLFRIELYPETRSLRYTYLSETWTEVTGLEIQRSLNDPLYSFSNILPDDLATVLKRVNDYENTQNFNAEVRMNHTPSGELRWLQISAHLYHASKKHIIYDGFILDITVRKNAEIELEKLSHRQAILIKVLQIVQSSENLTDAINESLAEIGKYSGASRVHVFVKSLDGATVSNTFGWCNDGIKPVIDSLQNIPIKVAASFFKMFDAGIYTCASNDKIIAPVLSKMLLSCEVKSLAVFPLSSGSDNYGFVIFDECVVKRKWDEHELELLKGFSQILSGVKHRLQAEQELVHERDHIKSIGDNFPGGALFRWEVNRETNDMRFTYLSKTWTDITGLDLQKSIDDVSYSFSTIVPEDAEILKNSINGYNDSLVVPETFDSLSAVVRIYHPSGEIRWLQIVSYPHIISEKQIVYNGYILDVTEKVMREQELEEYQNSLEIMVKERTEEVETTNEELCAANEELIHYRTHLEKMVESQTRELTESKERLTSLSDNLPGGAIFQMCGKSGEALQFTYISARFAELFNLAVNDVLDNCSLFFNMFHSDDQQKVLDLFGSDCSEFALIECRVCLETGETKWIQLRSSYHLQDSGVHVWDGFMIDINDRKIAGQQLEKLSRRQAILIDVLHIVQSAEDLPEAMNRSLAEIGRYAGVSRVNVFEKNDHGTMVSNAFGWCNDGIKPVIDSLQNIPIKIPAPFFKMFDAGIYTCSSDDKMLAPELSKLMLECDVKSLAVFPLSSGGDNYGFVIFDECVVKREWDEHELELLKSLSQIISDTKRRFQAEQDLFIERDHMKAIGDNFPNGALFRFEANPLTMEMRYTYLNETWEAITGFSREESMADLTKVFTAVFKEHIILILREIKKSMLTLQDFQIEIKSLYKGRDVRWLQVSSHPRKIADDKIIYDGFLLDITDRKHAEQSLLLERDRLRAIGDNFPEGSLFQFEINTQSGTMRFVYMSGTWEKVVGISIEESLADSSKVFALILPEHLPKFMDEIDKSVVSLKHYFMEIQFYKGSEVRWLLLSSHPKKISPNIVIYDGFVLDITDRKHAEQELRKERDRIKAIGDNFPNGALFRFEKNLETKEMGYTYLSDTWKKVTGLEIQRSLDDVQYGFSNMLPEDLIEFLNSVNNFENIEICNTEVRINHTPTGEIRWLHTLSHPRVFDKKIIYDGFILDVTDRKKAEIELIQAKEKAEVADKLKSAFLANMSHEILTPLNGIVGFLDVLTADEVETQQKQEYVNIINRSTEQLMHLINDIIDISKIQSKQVDIFPEAVNVNQMMKELYIFFDKFLSINNNDRIMLALDDNKFIRNCTTVVDPARLRQVLNILIGNAIKFTEKGLVSFGYRQTAPDKLEFAVKDTGIGIEQSQKEVIFECFRQIESDSTRFYGGTGIGLSIAQNLVHIMGGDIWVESTKGVGSSFYFTILYQPA